MAKLPQGFIDEIKLKHLSPYLRTKDLHTHAGDFGKIVCHLPEGIFTPETVKQLQKFLPIAYAHDVKMTCRGKGYSSHGHSQSQGGIIIDLSRLDIPLQYTSDDHTSVLVPSFKTWLEIIEFTKLQNMTVPVVLDYLDLTLGGTLCFGAIGGSSYLRGGGVDNVLSIEVVTLDGELHICSETQNQELFNAILGGIGQFGIIVSATIPLIPAKKRVNYYRLTYDNPNDYFKDQNAIFTSKVFDHLKGSIMKNNGAWEYTIGAATYYDGEEDSSIKHHLTQLDPHSLSMETMTFYDFIYQVTNFINNLRSAGKLDYPHPWYCVFIPEHKISEHLDLALESPYHTGSDPIIVYPMDSNKFKRPLFVRPDVQNCPTFYLLGILYNTSLLATPDYPYAEVLIRNQELYQVAKAVGGCRYPVDAFPFTNEDWRAHYGNKWELVRGLKLKYDPKNLLSSGVKMFE